MYCTKCGNKNEESAKLCSSCGTKLNSVNSEKIIASLDKKPMSTNKIKYLIIFILAFTAVISGFYFYHKKFSKVIIGQPKFEVKYGEKDNLISSGITEKNISKVKVLEYNNEPEVEITLDHAGREILEKITGDNIGKIAAIYLDNTPISMPQINEKIAGGKLVISGKFTKEEATLLKYRLQGYYYRGENLATDKLNKNEVVGSENIQENSNVGLTTNGQGLQINASHLLICFNDSAGCESGLTKEQAYQKISELKKTATPANFKELVIKNSTEPGADKTGGELGWFGAGVMVEPFEKVVINQKVGTISDIVETEFGYHLIYKKDEINK